MASTKKPVDFEQALTELEALVATMEKGELSLEESLKAFETGVKLTRECQQSLRDAEQKVQLLLSENGELRAEPFSDGESDGSSNGDDYNQ
jgi:exodeoxyribonuclease VII small subunit